MLEETSQKESEPKVCSVVFVTLPYKGNMYAITLQNNYLHRLIFWANNQNLYI